MFRWTAAEQTAAMNVERQATISPGTSPGNVGNLSQGTEGPLSKDDEQSGEQLKVQEQVVRCLRSFVLGELVLGFNRNGASWYRLPVRLWPVAW